MVRAAAMAWYRQWFGLSGTYYYQKAWVLDSVQISIQLNSLLSIAGHTDRSASACLLTLPLEVFVSVSIFYPIVSVQLGSVHLHRCAIFEPHPAAAPGAV